MASTMVVAVASLDDADDVASWINSILDEGLDESNDLGLLDARVGQLVSLVQVASHDASAQLEQTIEQVSRAVPRLTYDLQFMRDSAMSLHSSLHAVQTQSTPASVDISTAEALDRLSLLHTVKGRMEAVRDVLREAESWSTLESEVVALLQESAYDRAAERLADARRSMSVFQSTSSSPEQETRRALIVSLQNQLEAALSAALVSAVTAGDVAACRRFYTIFNNIERAPEFRNYYNGARRARLVDSWAAARLQDCDPNEASLELSSAQKLSEFLVRWLADFLQLVNAECTSVAQIFPDPQLSLSNLIQSVFDSLAPSLTQRLSSSADHHGPQNAITELINSYRAAEDFARGTERAMEKLHFSSALVTSPTPGHTLPATEEGHSRRPSRHSKRMSLSMRSNVAKSISILGNVAQQMNAAATQWAPALFEPFMPFQSDYAALEARLLSIQLSSSIPASHSSRDDRGDDAARRLRTRLLDVFNSCDDALSRCLSLTHGLAFPGLLRTLENQFKTFLQAQLKVCLDAHNSSKTTLKGGNGGGGMSGEELGLQLDYTDSDWRALRMALHLLQTAQDADGRLAALESRLRGELTGVATNLRGPQLTGAAPGHGHHNAAGFQAGQLPTTVPAAAMQLLISSTLNSAELHTLIDSVVEPLPAVPGTASLQTPATASLTISTPATATFGSTPMSPNFGRKALPGTTIITPPKPPPVLLPVAKASLVTFTRDTQSFLQRTIASPLLAHLSTYPSQAAFGESGTSLTAGGGAAGIHIPSFGHSPTPVMQRIADGILSLPQLFQVQEADDALGYSLSTLPHGLVRQTTQADAASPNSALEPPEEEDDPTTAWLASIVRFTIAHLTRVTLPAIPRLSSSGAKQLADDLEFLAPVLQTFGVEVGVGLPVDPSLAAAAETDLGLWREVLEMDERALRGEEGMQVEHISKLVRKMRGW
ncbi:oligomeric Golgi complex subunit 7 [Auriculariales sp. MPI-PUGE-AT-0066]|nr:oligomeric Golgi complex subunit 7 [Auriculariales sp. MPI-PUGE-AT-0066]